jgi:hypothetical protein
MTTTTHSHKAWTDKGGHVRLAQDGAALQAVGNRLVDFSVPWWLNKPDIRRPSGSRRWLMLWRTPSIPHHQKPLQLPPDRYAIQLRRHAE